MATIDESDNVLLHGSAAPPVDLEPLRAGPLTVVLDGIDLRYVRLDSVELVRRIYVAVRDRNWNTIAGVPSEIEAEREPDSFSVRFAVRHISHEVDFSWEGLITGGSDGRITYAMDGHARRSMLYNRIGFCVLHPWRECAGRPLRGVGPDGVVEGAFPLLVGPQRFENGVYVPLFPSVSRLSIGLESGGSVEFGFEGDLFETEDQRNWTDASFKTYCTPLALGFPHQLAEGERRSQTVSVSFADAPAASPARGGGELGSAQPLTEPQLTIGDPVGRRIPPIGLALTAPLSERERELLSALAPAHLRVEVHLADGGWPEAVEAAEFPLELAVFLQERDGAELSRLRELIAGRQIARVLVVLAGAQTATPEETTPPALVRMVREELGLSGVPVAGGTDMYFCELNRTRPEVADMDGIFWSLNPQVHAFDDISLMETPEAQGEQVRAALSFAGGKRIFVGPVTLRRRYNVNATVAEEEDAAAAELPDSVDPRQASLIGAAWTLASAKHLSEQGADAVTYFEAVGWRGVIQGDADPPSELFAARAGMAFPLFHVLADVCELRDAEILRCDTNRPLELAGLAARRQDGGLTALVANLTPRAVTMSLGGLRADGRVSVRRLNLSTAERAMSDPLAFRAALELEALGAMSLGPYESARIDTVS